MRSDTERLQFFLKFLNDTGGAGYSVETIDAAMDAAEAVEVDEAWKWFQGSGDGRFYSLHWGGGIEKWMVFNQHEDSRPCVASRHETKSLAVLAAYRASKGGEG